MPSGYRFALSVRRELVLRVGAGESMVSASAALGVSRDRATIWWRQAGGMALRLGHYGGLGDGGNPDLPGGRGHRLNLDERISIMRGRDRGLSCAAIARELGRDRSVVWRELGRHAAADGDYHAGLAHRQAGIDGRRPKVFKLADPGLCAQVTAWMDQGWSPGLIAKVLARDHPGTDPAARLGRVSHETIYQCLYVQARGRLRADLHRQLSTRRAERHHRDRQDNRGHPYREAFTISDRPAEVEDRAVPGHWEGDLIVGPASRSAIGTLVERSTRFTLLLHLPVDHTADAVAAAMIAAMGHLPDHLRRSLTWDRGVEMTRYRDIQLRLAMPVYFCDPHAPWQRGSNENTNRLLRFWFEKGSDLSSYTNADLRRVQDTLNRRPRPTLGLDTPAQRLAALLNQPVASTS